MKVEDIISRVRNIAGDVEALQFKDADVVQWINDAMRECASDNNLLQKTASSTTTIDVRQYDLPTDILKLHSVRYDGSDLSVLTLQEAQARGLLSGDSGTPQSCSVWAGKLELYPTPSDSASLEIYYTRTPVEVGGDADEPELPVTYHMRIVDYCLAQVAQQDDDMNRYAMKMDEFRTGVQKLLDVPEWENNSYPSISVSDRDGGGEYGWFE